MTFRIFFKDGTTKDTNLTMDEIRQKYPAGDIKKIKVVKAK